MSHSTASASASITNSLPLQDAVKLLSSSASSALATKVDLLKKVGQISAFADFVSGLGEAFAELTPISKAVAVAIRKTFERCQKISKAHDSAVNLIYDMASLLPLSDVLRERVKEQETRDVLKSFLELVEETAKVLIEYSSKPKFHARSWAASEQDRFDALKWRLDAMRQNINVFLTAGIHKTVTDNQDIALNIQDVVLDGRDRELLDRLHPVHEAHFDPGHSCLPGTRTAMLKSILDWATSADEPRKLLWLYGLAGSGKSTTASSVANALREHGSLAGCFFFKRDDPERRRPTRFLPTIAYALAHVFSPFQKALLQALKKDPNVAHKAVTLQFETLQ
ncbi:hypothetical protein EW145_g4527 [Phellinidium pouzarii]|uniref:Nephrocystin 3-like N-terminal domain-containing protein n=1 Tax=Phellinidium pouzarii TaxID=167371 RepID=A0A4S4L4J9_9AGAM|nr:hypothetical protein EW145_g4527 [Phellinidium pouzarii]